jgi:hypothetical protein
VTCRSEIRPRSRDDIPALIGELLAQQATTRYPFRDPLPVSVEQFLHAHDARAAWLREAVGDEGPEVSVMTM